jgi:hypothetical protein
MSAGFVDKLSESEAATLFLWLASEYPHDTDPDIRSGPVTTRFSVGRLRDAVLNQLKERGTPESRAAVEQLVEALPKLKWLKFVAADAATATLSRSWTPPSPAALLKIARDPRQRVVESGTQLLEVIVESLTRLAAELQGETPAAPDLWDQTAPGVFKPKEENRLSDYLTRHLRRDLPGIIINREVEIRPSLVPRRTARGPSPGERTDLKVEVVATASTKESVRTLAVLIEVKGCWNSAVMTATRTQLRDRYLRDNPCRTGLYVVGWFDCPQWSREDQRRRKVPAMSMDELRQALARQAADLSSGQMTLRSFVLDATLRHEQSLSDDSSAQETRSRRVRRS